MIRYYKIVKNGKLFAVGTGYGGTEITEEEYNDLMTEICTKAELAEKLYNREITIDDVPTEWREEIQRRVYDRISEQGAIGEQDISTDEFMEMLDEVM